MTAPAAAGRRADRGGRRAGRRPAFGRLRAHLRIAALAWLACVCCLIAWSLAPLVVGWHPELVLTGSMRPTIKPGDVVLVDTSDHHPRVGQIAMLRDPDVPTGRVTHRVVAVRSDGRYVTRGDANDEVDARSVAPCDVLGVARMVVPGAGRVAMLTHRPELPDIAWTALTAVSILVLVAVRPD